MERRRSGDGGSGKSRARPVSDGKRVRAFQWKATVTLNTILTALLSEHENQS